MHPNAATAASCDSVGAQMYRFCWNRSTPAISSGGAVIQPRRQPVIEKYLEKLLTTTASGLMASALSARSP